MSGEEEEGRKDWKAAAGKQAPSSLAPGLGGERCGELPGGPKAWADI